MFSTELKIIICGKQEVEDTYELNTLHLINRAHLSICHLKKKTKHALSFFSIKNVSPEIVYHCILLSKTLWTSTWEWHFWIADFCKSLMLLFFYQYWFLFLFCFNIWFLSFFLNWKIIALQCCLSFCCTTMWISYLLVSHACSVVSAYLQPHGL